MIKTLEDRREKNVKPHVFSCGLYQAKETVLIKRIEVASALRCQTGKVSYLSLFVLKVWVYINYFMDFFNYISNKTFWCVFTNPAINSLYVVYSDLTDYWKS